jgi:alkylation response protein AidB-like acyl-CoA dehydrogenase
MDFELNEVQKILRKSARDFLQNECPESLVRQMEDDEVGYSPRLWHQIADLGWLGIIYPEEYGGSGGSVLDMAILYEEMGRAMLPGPHLSTVVLCGLTILNAGTEDQKKEFLPEIADGGLTFALALTEPEASWEGKAWDAAGVTVRATAEGDDYIIDGTKLFVFDAGAANYLLCVTRTKSGGRPEDGITLFLVDAKSAGITRTILRTTAGDKRQSELVFNKVRVPKKNMVGELNAGWEPLQKAMQVGSVLLCAQMVGASEAAMEMAVDHAKTRVQFDMPIGIHNWVQDYCIQAFADVQGSRNVVYEAAWMLSEDVPCDMEVSMAKARTNDASESALWNAHQVLAGVGFTTQDGILPLYTKRNKADTQYLGDTDYHLEKIAQHIEKWPAREKPKGKPLGIFNVPEDLQTPAWDIWREQKKGKLW